MADKDGTQAIADFKLKFTARIVDKIERKYNVSIESLLGDTSVRSLAFFIEQSYYDEENETIGANNEKSFTLLENYLKNNDKEDLLMYIMECLQQGGFLSRKIDIDQMRSNIDGELEKAIKKPTDDDSANSGKN
jgi:hypothetical protein